MGELIIYNTDDGQNEVEVRLDDQTVWLTIAQMAELFERDKSVISRHIRNIYKEGELAVEATVAKNATVQEEGGRPVERKLDYYNLDVIISVGYRVKSQRGVQFRIWATNRLKDYLIQGYAINNKRLAQLSKVVEVIEQTGDGNLQIDEAKGLLEILGKYAKSFALLSKYDSNSLKNEGYDTNITYEIEYAEAKKAIDELRKQLEEQKEATNLFGNERDDSFRGILSSIIQTFGGKYLYPTIEEQAAHLLYFVVKNHPFTDGNKRIGAFMFVWFLEKNKHQLKSNGEVKVNDNALTSLTLLTAQSNPDDKEVLIQLICNLIKDDHTT